MKTYGPLSSRHHEVTIVFPTRAAADRAHRAHRDALIADLGWAPEGHGPLAYLASTVELELWLNERLTADGDAPIPHVSFTDSMNLAKVAEVTCYYSMGPS